MSQTVRQTMTTRAEEEEEEEGAAGAIVRTYQEGERIFVEQSRKFDAPSLERLCRSAGLFTRRTWSDTDGFTLISEVSVVNCLLIASSHTRWVHPDQRGECR
jgi:uncharacterized SAM-dependent methyltransferase